MKLVTLVVAGAGNRGIAYGSYALENPFECKVVGIAEPDAKKREEYCKKHGIKKENAFESYEDMFSRPRFADAALICTPDNMHYESVYAAKKQGYHILLEKPIANTLEDCKKVSRLFASSHQMVAVCHVLRYTPFFQEIKQLLRNKKLGQILSIQHSENIGYYHFAHSYVRGNWKDSKASSPMILAKACHDFDILQWLIEDDIDFISSFGTLSHFKLQNKPEGAPENCMDGCPAADSCPYNAVKIYLQSPPGSFPRSIIEMQNPHGELYQTLRDSEYSRCVYQCSNDVVDHQVVNMISRKGCTISLNVSAFTEKITRQIVIMCSKGQIKGNMEKNYIEYFDFTTSKREVIKIPTQISGHSGGDAGIMKSFVNQLRENLNNMPTTIENSLVSHYLAFAAEKSRIENKVIDLRKYYETNAT